MNIGELNDTLEIYSNTEEKNIEIEIVKYLNNLGI